MSARPEVITDEIRTSLVGYLLRLGDDNLILAQRLAEWSSCAPDLEEDVALTNIALDLLGRARFLLTYAGEVERHGQDEDWFAFFRDEREFTNLLLVEQPNGDFAATMARQFFFDAWSVPLWEHLSASTDSTLAGIAGKAAKESRYHLRHSSAWVTRLGDGTEESHRRMQAAVDALWRFTDEMFWSDGVEAELAELGMAVLPARLRPRFDRTIDEVLARAGLQRPADTFSRTGGRLGIHTEHLGHLLAEMQHLQRAYPGRRW